MLLLLFLGTTKGWAQQPIYFWGDSYTAGTGIPEAASFPAQVIDLLQQQKNLIQPYEVLASRGRTTEQLLALLPTQLPQPRAIVLLIGVNDQYAGEPVDSFAASLNLLLGRIKTLAQGAPVLVLSIPNYGVTPFIAQLVAGETALEELRLHIGAEILAYNEVLAAQTLDWGFDFLNISEAYEQNGHRTENLAPDGLHPSKLIYSFWAAEITKYLLEKT